MSYSYILGFILITVKWFVHSPDINNILNIIWLMPVNMWFIHRGDRIRTFMGGIICVQ